MNPDEFPIGRLCAPDADAEVESRVHRQFLTALTASINGAGIEQTIDALNACGHSLMPVESGSGSQGWQIFRESGADGERDFQISIETETGDVMLTTPMSDGAWERMLASREAGLTPSEREEEARREAFYERGGKLFVERSDDASTLDERDYLLMALYMLDVEVNNGGFSQYFDNTGGRDAERALRYLRDVGAPKAQALLRRAVNMIVGPFGDALDDRQHEALDAHEAELGELDDAYYALDEDIALVSMRWLDEN